MKVKFVKPYRDWQPGNVWNSPWACEAIALINDGFAVAIEPADLHLNPPAEGSEEGAEGEPEGEAQAEGDEPQPAAKKTRKRK